MLSVIASVVQESLLRQFTQIQTGRKNIGLVELPKVVRFILNGDICFLNCGKCYATLLKYTESHKTFAKVGTNKFGGP